VTLTVDIEIVDELSVIEAGFIADRQRGGDGQDVETGGGSQTPVDAALTVILMEALPQAIPGTRIQSTGACVENVRVVDPP
jgi:hypothetical protein